MPAEKKTRCDFSGARPDFSPAALREKLTAASPQLVPSLAIREALAFLQERDGGKVVAGLFDGKAGEVAVSTVSNWIHGRRAFPIDALPYLVAAAPELGQWLRDAADFWTGVHRRVIERLDSQTAERVRDAYFEEVRPGTWGRR